MTTSLLPPTRRPLRVVGLMSGTSLDGCDAALVAVMPRATGLDLRLEAFLTVPMPPELRAAITAQLSPETSRIDLLAELDTRLGEFFAQAALAVIEKAGGQAPDLVGSHGQTLWHRPQGEAPTTLQLGDGSLIAVRTGVTTVSDFRKADVAAGGQGAPLVPFVDQLLFGGSAHTVALQNLGGIANVTVLTPGHAPLAFDTGPANMVIDRFVERFTEGREQFDPDGRYAARGRVDERLLEAWLAHPFFAARPPKSTGREEFGHDYADARYDEALAQGLTPEDAIATATALTVRSIARAYRDFLPELPHEILVSGGGAHNQTLMTGLQRELPEAQVRKLEERGFDADAKEAVAFAILAYQVVFGAGNHLPETTGASTSVLLGKISPGRNFQRMVLAAGEATAERPVTETGNPLSERLDELSAAEITALMSAEDARAVEAVAQQAPAIAKVAKAAAEAIRQGGRVFYVGAGTSGRLGVLDASEIPPTFSAPPEWFQGLIAGGSEALTRAIEGAEDDAEAGTADLVARGVSAKDLVVGIAASGGTPYVHGALKAAKRVGARTALIACNPLPALDYVDQGIALIVGPEVLTGSTRLKAGTATKLALNQISTAAMVLLGKVYGNLMVDVTISNRKLRARALRIIRTVTGVDEAEAETLLDRAEGSVKLAIALHATRLSPEAAREALQAVQGRLRSVLERP
ncbi:N-acetylmuramic acid 6-phosphate etherase [compost metagenome]